MMKKFFCAALVLPLVLFAVSCGESNDDGGNDGSVTLAPGTTPVQQVYADEQQGPAPIKFTAAGPWTATVVAVATKAEGGSEVDWLTLSAYRGGAGEVSLTMGLQPNLTGHDRKAEIRIACEGTTITITVVQKGTTESGETPEPGTDYALVESIEANFFVGCQEGSIDKNHYVFRYDHQNRIAEYEFTQTDYNNDTGKFELDYTYTTRLDYSIQGEIRLTEKTTYDEGGSDEPETETYRILLDDQGRATQIESGSGSQEDKTSYAYNDEGRLSRISWYDYGGLCYNDMTYQNGVFSKVVYDYDHVYEKDEIIFPADAFSDRPNNRLSIDPNWLLFTAPDEPQYMLPMLRLAGKGCDRLTLWLPNDDLDHNAYDPGGGRSEPNVTIHMTEDYVEHDTGRLQYTFNDDGTIATIVQPITCIQMRYEYDIVVGNELYNPQQPEQGYKWTIRNETTRETGRSTDRHEWTFTYRQ